MLHDTVLIFGDAIQQDAPEIHVTMCKRHPRFGVESRRKQVVLHSPSFYYRINLKYLMAVLKLLD